MASARTGAAGSFLTGVPRPGPGVCNCCNGPARPGHRSCFCCAQVARVLGALAPVVPISLCPVPGPLYNVLFGYKEGPVHEARQRFERVIASTLETFVREHGPCLVSAAGGLFDVVVPVPSSRRPADVPVARLVPPTAAAIGTAQGRDVEIGHGRLRRGGGRLGHLTPSRDGFEPDAVSGAGFEGRRVLLLDDLLTTGARAQSAAYALRKAGALAVVCLVVGRAVRPSRLAAWGQGAAGQPDTDGRCCLPDCPNGAGLGAVSWR